MTVAVKIITPGKSPLDRVMRGRCGSCGCEVECLQRDTRRDDKVGYGEVSRYYIHCPTVACDNPILYVVAQKGGPQIP